MLAKERAWQAAAVADMYILYVFVIVRIELLILSELVSPPRLGENGILTLYLYRVVPINDGDRPVVMP